MQFEVLRSELMSHVEKVVRACASRVHLPILEMMLVKQDHEKLVFIATDTEIQLQSNLMLSSLVSEVEEATLPAHKFHSILKSIANTAWVSVETTGLTAKVKSGRSQFNLKCLPAEDFPNSPEMTQPESLSMISHRELRALLKRTFFSAAKNDVRYYLNGVFFDVTQKGFLKAVTTDGHRLASAEHPCGMPDNQNENSSFIIPTKTVTEMMSLLSDSDEEVAVEFDARHLRVRFSPELTLTSQLIDGRFPDYEMVIPKDPPHVIIAESAALQKALQQAAILSNEKFKGVRLQFSENELKITGRNPEQDESEVVIEVENQGGADFEIGFNVQYLLDVLNVITTEQVEIHATDGNGSILMLNYDSVTERYVVMPMRL